MREFIESGTTNGKLEQKYAQTKAYSSKEGPIRIKNTSSRCYTVHDPLNFPNLFSKASSDSSNVDSSFLYSLVKTVFGESSRSSFST